MRFIPKSMPFRLISHVKFLFEPLCPWSGSLCHGQHHGWTLRGCCGHLERPATKLGPPPHHLGASPHPGMAAQARLDKAELIPAAWHVSRPLPFTFPSPGSRNTALLPPTLVSNVWPKSSYPAGRSHVMMQLASSNSFLSNHPKHLEHDR